MSGSQFGLIRFKIDGTFRSNPRIIFQGEVSL
jgi:hypothetical protein